MQHGREREDGSSPRTWGTQISAACLLCTTRLIPTHVGNASPPSMRCWPAAAHPHARGERYRLGDGGWTNGGSSPRTWGTPLLALRPPEPCPAHPHARGERTRFSLLAGLRSGSSPRAWGTRWDCARDWYADRLIPTRVGNATISIARQATMSGSSPRAWGTHRRWHRGQFQYRLIPTRVGNATAVPERPGAASAHPHARGERSSFNYLNSHAFFTAGLSTGCRDPFPLNC